MKSTLRTALTLFVLLTLLTGVVYPALVTLVAQGVFPHQANGSVLTKGGKSIGSELIGHLSTIRVISGAGHRRRIRFRITRVPQPVRTAARRIRIY